MEIKYLIIIIIIFIIAIISIIALFFILKRQNNVQDTCGFGKEQVTIGDITLCKDICDVNSSRCGETCIDNKLFICDNNKIFPRCGETYCKDSEICDTENKKCITYTSCSTPKILCGNTCCNPENCIGGKNCCEDNTICYDIDNRQLDICFDSSRCTKTTNNKAICCPNSSYKYEDGKCKIPCGNEYCNTEIQDCYTDIDKNIKYCVNRQCSFLDYDYYPQSIDIDNDNKLLVCSEENGKLFFNKDHFNGIKTEILANTYAKNKDMCMDNGNSCRRRLAEDKLINVEYDEQSGKCSASGFCSEKLKQYNTCPLNSQNQRSCCFSKDGKITGQVCRNQNYCVNGICICKDWDTISKTISDCYNGKQLDSNICSNNGKFGLSWDKNIPKTFCECNYGYGGDLCDRFVNLNTDNYIRYLVNITKNQFRDYYVTPVSNQISRFLIIPISGVKLQVNSVSDGTGVLPLNISTIPSNTILVYESKSYINNVEVEILVTNSDGNPDGHFNIKQDGPGYYSNKTPYISNGKYGNIHIQKGSDAAEPKGGGGIDYSLPVVLIGNPRKYITSTTP